MMSHNLFSATALFLSCSLLTFDRNRQADCCPTVQSKSPTQSLPIACRPKAMREQERRQHRRLAMKLHEMRHEVRQIQNGYEIHYRDMWGAYALAGPWAVLELRCCPFLEVSLNLSDSNGLTVRITGPQGAEDVVKEELHALLG